MKVIELYIPNVYQFLFAKPFDRIVKPGVSLSEYQWTKHESIPYHQGIERAQHFDG